MKTSYTTDAIPNWLMINSLKNEHNLSLNEYREELTLRGIMGVVVETEDGNLIAKTPPLVAITAYPFFIFFDNLVKNLYEVKPGEISEYYQYIGKITASFFISITGLIMFLLLLKISKNSITVSILGSAIYVLGTPLFSIAGQALWQHPMSILLLTATLFLFQKIPNIKNKNYFYTNLFLIGLLSGTAVGVRFNNIFPFLIIFLYIAYKYKKYALFFILGSLPSIIFNCYYNYKYFNNILSIGYGNAGQVYSFMDASSVKAFFGLFLSYNFGLFIFYPILILTIFGILYFIKNRKMIKDSAFYCISLVIILVNIIFISNYRWYTGGHSWPSRMLAETIPFLFIFLVPFWEFTKSKKVITYLIILPLFTITLCLNFMATYMNDYSYHVKYYTNNNVDGWIWDKNKNFILFYIKKGDIFLTKFVTKKDNSLAIKTSTYNIYSRKINYSYEPMETINTCSFFDSFDESKNIASEKYNIAISRIFENTQIINSINGKAQRTVSTISEISSNGSIIYNIRPNEKLNGIIITLDGENSSENENIIIQAISKDRKIFEKRIDKLEYSKKQNFTINGPFEENEKIIVNLILYSSLDKPNQSKFDTIGFCLF